MPTSQTRFKPDVLYHTKYRSRLSEIQLFSMKYTAHFVYPHGSKPSPPSLAAFPANLCTITSAPLCAGLVHVAAGIDYTLWTVDLCAWYLMFVQLRKTSVFQPGGRRSPPSGSGQSLPPRRYRGIPCLFAGPSNYRRGWHGRATCSTARSWPAGCIGWHGGCCG